MIGDIPEQDKVIKFWNGSQSIIQKGLWQDNLNPEISTWDEVVNQAEIIEISENIAEYWDQEFYQSYSHGASENPHASGKRDAGSKNHKQAVGSEHFDAVQHIENYRKSHQHRKSGFHQWNNHQHFAYPGDSRLPSQGRFSLQAPLAMLHMNHAIAELHYSTPQLSEREKEELCWYYCNSIISKNSKYTYN